MKTLYSSRNCQTTVLFLSLGMIALVMWPSRVNTLRPALAESCMKWHLRGGYDSFACRSAAELLGLYIVMVVGTRIFPQSLRFKDWKRWMRAELTLWSIVVLTVVGTYFACI